MIIVDASLIPLLARVLPQMKTVRQVIVAGGGDLLVCAAPTMEYWSMTGPEQPSPSHFPVDVPTPARMYDYCLGGKDNFAIDRETVLTLNAQFPEGFDAARENRRFLYRVVRYLARDAGIRQFLDMGSGLPTQANVHEIAQRFQDEAHVVYVDNDPIVSTHGRALLADDMATTVIAADMTKPHEVLGDHHTRRLIDFDKPVAALFLSVPHSIPDDELARHTISTVAAALVPGSFLALSQYIGVDREAAAEHTEKMRGVGLAWTTRTAEDIADFVAGLEPVPPGLVDVVDWHPDPQQPPLNPVDEPLRPYLGMAARNKRVKEFGGVVRKT